MLLAQHESRAALEQFEKALLHVPDHHDAIVNAANVMLDIYRQAVPAERSLSVTLSPSANSKANSNAQILTGQDIVSSPTSTRPKTQNGSARSGPSGKSHHQTRPSELSPEELNRLAARDRAYSLLNNLTKLGAGWDSGEAWYALASCYEESGQLEKAKECLWWCVELEDTRPLRPWGKVSAGGMVL